MSKFGLSQDVIDSLNKVFSQFSKVDKVLLYGSRSKGNYLIGSDIDLTLIGNELDMTELFKIENFIEGLYLPYKIDLSIFHKIENLELIKHIEKFGVEFL